MTVFKNSGLRTVMNLRFYHDPGFAAPIGDHMMPMSKFALVAEELRRKSGFEICSPQPLSERDLLRVHTPEYVLAVKTGSPRESRRISEVSVVAGFVLQCAPDQRRCPRRRQDRP